MQSRVVENAFERRSARDPRRLVPPAATLAAVAAFSFLSGGYIFVRSAPVAIVYLLLAAGSVWFLRRPPRLPRLFTLALAVYGLFVAWAGVSVLWSIGPDLSWIAFDLALLYLVVMAFVGLVPVARLELRLVGAGYLAISVVIAGYAFLGKALPEVVTHAHEYARLSSPVGYWNVLALMIAMALPPALAFAADGRAGIAARVAAAAAAVPLLFAFFFSFSRGGWIALVIMLVVYFALAPQRLSSFATMVAVGAPVGYVIWRLRDASSLFEATSDAALRTSEGHTLLVWSLVALVIAAALQAAVALLQRGRPLAPRTRMVAGAALLVVVVVAGAFGSWRFVEARGGGEWVRDRAEAFLGDADETSSANSAGRLFSLNTGRLPLWREALEQTEVAPMAGTGAGTFPLTHYRFRTYEDVVRHAHSQWLNVLSELGAVGAALFAAAMILLLAAAFGNPLAGRRDPSRALLVALQAGALAFAIHMSWDWDWDMAAAGVTFFLFASACASYVGTRRLGVAASAAPPASDGARLEAAEAPAPVTAQTEVSASAVTEADDAADAADAGGADRAAGRSAAAMATGAAGRRLAWPLRLALCLLLALAAVSWTLPYLAARAERDAITASAEENPTAALDEARRAARYNPLAASPLILQAQILQTLGRNREALDVLRQAVHLQPDDFEVYRELGLLYMKAYSRKEEAAAAFEQALSLNPNDRELQAELQRALAR
jgi:O-antigen ligase/cytochrome c-type biogenesis protein CcmH/NrfG